MSREIPQPVVAHHNAKSNYSCQFFMFGPPSHAFDSFPVVCSILVFLKISLNFVVKYSVGVRYIFCSWRNNAPTLATLSFRQPRQDWLVVLTIVAPSNDHTEHPIEKPTYIRLLSCSLYNSLYNLKTRQGQLHWLKLEPAKIQNLENCKQDISLYIFLEKQLNVVFEIKLETRVTALKKILKKLMCSLFHLLRFNEKKGLKIFGTWNFQSSQFVDTLMKNLTILLPYNICFLTLILGINICIVWHFLSEMGMGTFFISTVSLWNLIWKLIDHIYNVFIERDAKCTAWTTLSGVAAWQLSVVSNL